MTTLTITNLIRDFSKKRAIVSVQWQDDPEKHLGLVVPFDCALEDLRGETEKAVKALARELDAAMVQGV